jgi:pyridoxamine 5'-phosphate oxidase
MSLADLRTDYQQSSLSETDVLSDPIEQFAVWFEQALKAEVKEPNVMGVSTVNQQGRPTSRILLIKEFDQRGFTWFTNYHSSKGQDLDHHPYAALLFFWVELERQVRIEGKVEKISVAESEQYFNSRPLGSRRSAITSQQSQPISNRDELETRLAEVTATYGDHPPRPEHWGGYRLVPEHIEFWQGRASRLHDRICYDRNPDGTWTLSRLQP